jgi:hypothetical protein
MLLIFKAMPIYLLHRAKAPIKVFPNLVFSLAITIVYLGYVELIKGISVIEVYKDAMKSIIKKENKTPFFKLYSLIAQKFQ